MPEPLLVCLFHLNLNFSSLEEEQRPEIIRNCYWPVLDLARTTGFPISLELTGWTLRTIRELDAEWVDACRELIRDGKVELVGSAWSQCAAPLLPAAVNEWNLRLGRQEYANLLGTEPKVALLSEQAYAPGLLALYRDAGYDAVVADWDNAFRPHPRWSDSYRLLPQIAVGECAQLPVIWSQSMAFQKLQRYAYGEIGLDEYLDFVASASDHGALLLYANDAEVFDHRPGRFEAEPPVELAEWRRIEECLGAVIARGIGTLALCSDVLGLLGRADAGNRLRLEAASDPVPVKKQDKYNVARWACTGRDDIGINTRCWRLFDLLAEASCDAPDEWRALCELWATDFRTHITERRWERYRLALAGMERRWLPRTQPQQRKLSKHSERVDSGRADVTLRSGPVRVTLSPRRGLAIRTFWNDEFGDDPLFGTIPHGFFNTIDLGADWYSGSLVQEAPLRHKVTDLAPATPELTRDGSLVAARSIVETPLGPVEKEVTLDGARGELEIEYLLRWPELPVGSLRLGYVTLLPDAFAVDDLWFGAHNGGRELERQAVGSEPFDHGAPVSALVSARQGIGATEGVLYLGDARRALQIEIDQSVAKPLALVSFRPARTGYLFRACFSLTEQDETRRGAISREGEPQRFRMRVSVCRTADRAGRPASPARATARQTA